MSRGYESAEHVKDPGTPSQEIIDLERTLRQRRSDDEIELGRAMKKEWVKDVMNLPTVLRVQIKIDYLTIPVPVSLDVRYGGKQTDMSFDEFDIHLLAPLLNIRAFNIHALKELGTEEAET